MTSASPTSYDWVPTAPSLLGNKEPHIALEHYPSHLYRSEVYFRRVTEECQDGAVAPARFGTWSARLEPKTRLAHRLRKFFANEIIVEDCPSGYPQYSALLASHQSFNVYRRFSTLRTRLMLLKQDRLTVLEHRLRKLDLEEPSKIFLGCSRKDVKSARCDVLEEIGEALSDYGNYFDPPCDLLPNFSR